MNNDLNMKDSPNSEEIARRDAIASRLRAAREAAGLSQGQVARQLKMHRPTISEIEAGRRRVSVDEVAEFADLYGVTIDWLSCSESSTIDPTEDRLKLAARELSRLKPEDLNRLLGLLHSLRAGENREGSESSPL